jgi:hypothetical protein
MGESQVLSHASAFDEGADLWIVPEFDSSRWTEKLDWYLNFQILRNHRHAMPEVRNYTLYVQNETGLESFRQHLPKTAPLMINSESYFPNKWVVVVPVANEFSHWVKAVSDVWENLKNPPMRVFLPTGQSAGSFLDAWTNHHTFADFTLVLD